LKTNFRYIQLALLICGFSTHSVYAESSGYFEVDPDQMCSPTYQHEHCPEGSLIYIDFDYIQSEPREYIYPTYSIGTWCDLAKPVIQLPRPHVRGVTPVVLCISRGATRNFARPLLK